MRTITVEEHFTTPAFLERVGGALPGRSTAQRDQLADLGAARIAAMNEAGIDVQVLSLNAPGVEQLEAADAIRIAREANDVLANAVARHPARFAGLAAVPTAAPAAAAEELDREVRGRGMKGCVVHGHVRGRYLDDPVFRPFLERAEALQVPIYLHPTLPPRAVIETSYGGFAPAVTELLAGPGWGWHIETAVHVIRMILGGVFDRHPRLQIVIGHLGEALPFMLPRLDVMPQSVTKLARPVSAYLRENVHYTISGFNYMPAFLDLMLEVGAERIMFSADYPYGSMANARAFLERLPVGPADRQRIAHGNAERLLAL
jgi:predicted TIM-barrel fold metal-dependent hydrolase